MASRYVSDIVTPDMLHGAPVPSTESLAVVTVIDATAAKQLPGVIDVIVAADIPGTNDISGETCGPRPTTPAAPISDQLLVPATGTTVYVGQSLALVVATSRRVALQAAKLVQVHMICCM